VWDRWGTWGRQEVNKILVGNPKEKRQLGRHRCKLEDLKEIGCEGEPWIQLAEVRV
jgi:hypothetical protein